MPEFLVLGILQQGIASSREPELPKEAGASLSYKDLEKKKRSGYNSNSVTEHSCLPCAKLWSSIPSTASQRVQYRVKTKKGKAYWAESSPVSRICCFLSRDTLPSGACWGRVYCLPQPTHRTHLTPEWDSGSTNCSTA